jgi:hypothetical protein
MHAFLQVMASSGIYPCHRCGSVRQLSCWGSVTTPSGDGSTTALCRPADAAAPANFDSASVLGNLTTPTSGFTEALAGGGLSNLGGSNDLSFIVDPFGTAGSTADAGLGYNFDLAGALGDNLAASATGANNLIDIRRAEASGALVAATRTS